MKKLWYFFKASALFVLTFAMLTYWDDDYEYMKQNAAILEQKVTVQKPDWSVKEVPSWAVDPTRDKIKNEQSWKFETSKEISARAEKEFQQKEAQEKAKADSDSSKKADTQKSASSKSDSSWWSSSSQPTKTTQKACKKYQDKAWAEYKTYCSNITFCDWQYAPKNEWQNILKIEQIPFLPVPNGNVISSASDWEYWSMYSNYLTSLLWADASMPNIWAKPLEQAKNLYIETQNAIYNCAVLEAKLKIWKNIIELMKSDKSSNIVSKIERLNDDINQEIQKKNCNKPSAEKKDAYRTILLKNITFHYCNYRHYLNYLSSFPDENILSSTTISSKVQRPWDDKMSTVNMANFSKLQTNTIKKEIAHERQVYLMSVSTFSEFENTYGAHILLTLIFDDYNNIRKNLSKLLNPISQLVYKIPQAQCQSWCK